MVMSSFEHVPASGVVHRCCSHLIDELRDASPGLPPVMYWCASHAGASGLLCPECARRHEEDEHHGDASFTSAVPMPIGIEMADTEGRTLVVAPDGVTIALMVFYAD